MRRGRAASATQGWQRHTQTEALYRSSEQILWLSFQSGAFQRFNEGHDWKVVKSETDIQELGTGTLRGSTVRHDLRSAAPHVKLYN